MDWAKTTARGYKKHLNFGIWGDLHKRFYGRWLSPDLHMDVGPETHWRPCQFFIVQTWSIFLNWIYENFDVESMLFMIHYLKKICGINQAKDRVMWPDHLHRQTSTLTNFWEQSFASTSSRIQGWPRNRSWLGSSDSSSTWWHAVMSCHIVILCHIMPTVYDPVDFSDIAPSVKYSFNSTPEGWAV